MSAGVVLLVAAVAIADSDLFSGESELGRNSRYHWQFDEASDAFRQDISGAAVGRHGVTIVVDDGGKPSDFSFIRVLRSGLPDAEVDADGHIVGDDPSVNIPLALDHQDMEGATYTGRYFVVTSSLSASGGNSVDARNRLTRFKLRGRSNVLRQEETRSDLRGALIDAIVGDIGGRFSVGYNFNAGGTSGGLNIEGLATLVDDDDNNSCRGRSHSSTLLWGLRSPLAYADPTDPTNQKLGWGAIVASIDDAWGDASIEVFDILDLGDGQGIRGIEWVPALDAYIIIAGTLVKASDYHLWLWAPDEALLVEITGEVENFAGLCRPEAVIQAESGSGDDALAILSEESGTACEFVDFNYIIKPIDD